MIIKQGFFNNVEIRTRCHSVVWPVGGVRERPGSPVQLDRAGSLPPGCLRLQHHSLPAGCVALLPDQR